jgi:transposase
MTELTPGALCPQSIISELARDKREICCALYYKFGYSFKEIEQILCISTQTRTKYLKHKGDDPCQT